MQIIIHDAIGRTDQLQAILNPHIRIYQCSGFECTHGGNPSLCSKTLLLLPLVIPQPSQTQIMGEKMQVRNMHLFKMCFLHFPQPFVYRHDHDN